MFQSHSTFKASLQKISVALNEGNITWCIGASGSLYVQGVMVEPKDLDIIVEIDQFTRACELLAHLNPGPREEGMFGDDKYSKAALQAAEFPSEIVGFSLDQSTIIMIDWEGVKSYVHPLTLELEMYKKRQGKERIVALIEQTLRSK